MAKGNIIVHISNDKLANIMLPLPPIEEQHRIVSRVEELMSKIDEYEKLEDKLAHLKEKFPEEMNASILQAAMEGKLTEQNKMDSSAFDLIESIREERTELAKNKKIKKLKNMIQKRLVK